MIDRSRLFYMAVYESHGRISGLVGLDLNEIRLLFVSPGSRRQGIGRALLEHVKSMVPPVFFTDIFVYSSIQAVGFYQGCGFKERGSCSFDLRGESLPTVFMTLSTDSQEREGLENNHCHEPSGLGPESPSGSK
jgi:hypothetical protein